MPEQRQDGFYGEGVSPPPPGPAPLTGIELVALDARHFRYQPHNLIPPQDPDAPYRKEWCGECRGDWPCTTHRLLATIAAAQVRADTAAWELDNAVRNRQIYSNELMAGWQALDGALPLRPRGSWHSATEAIAALVAERDAATARAEDAERALAYERGVGCDCHGPGMPPLIDQVHAVEVEREIAQGDAATRRAERDAALVTAGLAVARAEAIQAERDRVIAERNVAIRQAAAARTSARARSAALEIAETRIDGLRTALERAAYYARTGNPEAAENTIKVAFETDKQASFAQMAAAGEG